jgi:hypothetical protein
MNALNLHPKEGDPRRPIRGDRRLHPSASTVEACVQKAASAAGLAPVEVIGASRERRASAARRAAWATLLRAGYSISGIATVWGCDRRSIQRLKRRSETA